jgi:uncharacterized coiled-coil protein SlyX
MSEHLKNFWRCMDELAMVLECDQADAEQTLDELEMEVASLTAAERDAVRKKMIGLVAQLSRLEVRMMTKHGPLRLSN